MNSAPSAAAPFAPDLDTLARSQASPSALGVIAALAAFGVFLVFGHAPGLGAALFIAAIETAAAVAARTSLGTRSLFALLGAATLAPLVEDANALSIAIAIFGAGVVALIANGGARGDFARTCLRVLSFLATGPFQAPFDLPGIAIDASRGGIGARALIAWVLPLGLGAVFLALFANANPVIEGWLSALDFAALLAALDVRRTAFGLILVAAVWPFVLFRTPARKSAPAVAPNDGPVPSVGSRLLLAVFTDAAILRSLILFNTMFAVQTVLDVSILWGGHGLPAGVSFASYAHRGAYLLVATALLAGGFVALAMRPVSGAAKSSAIQALVYAWVAQNVALVVFSLYRLYLYVGVYSLTYWRVAAFVWMVLVAGGLVLIVVQIAARRSSRWLFSANLAMGAAALYLVAFVDVDFLVADFNLTHCYEAVGDGARLDVVYLGALGPDAIPALDRALTGKMAGAPRLIDLRASLDDRRRGADGDWRSWTYRAWRLSRRLDAGSPS